MLFLAQPAASGLPDAPGSFMAAQVEGSKANAVDVQFLATSLDEVKGEVEVRLEMKPMGKLWENWEIYGKSMGSLWEVYGKLGNLWEVYGKWKIYGKSAGNGKSIGKSMVFTFCKRSRLINIW